MVWVALHYQLWSLSNRPVSKQLWKIEGQCGNTVAKEVPRVLTVHSRDSVKAQRDFSKSKPKAVKPRGPNPSGFSDKGLPNNLLNFYCEC